MQIAKDTVVTLHYEMFDTDGKQLDKTEQPIAYLHGGYDNILPLVEEALQGKTVGDSIDVTMEPEDAFGEFEAELVRTEARDVFPMEVEEGMMFEADDPETGDVLLFRVTKIEGDQVTVDANHPFAGVKIRFVGKVEDVREASSEEITHGHVHGEHGHHH
ncbi:FKBP-type peptidyl-prolyl cis-trans isomerase [Amantichitinum ursilacus]|uniref:Peptidyl-prolyl cis-trans isomerase n=1 Tax=Amantichitinum ursilacus TaxID=857265 RepID=A0A0N0XK75_9NEIS|nr:peptidylprolyl isomerase [Amantichitinum ursilacus]KPC52537.1 FKBP-type peptidyl-prolyl cis-trans isomerase SlyD [Amantichitinum ursilacus]